MNFPRRSLSASFGSWAVQLVYNPRVAPDASSPAAATARVQLVARAALWPAFFAMLLAVAAACYGLAHFIALPAAPRVLSVTLLGVFGIAWGARCGAPLVRRACSGARWPAAFVLGVCALSLRWSEEFAPLLAGEPNMQAAVFCGFIMLLSVLLIGARSGGRLVPVAAPLVPALSLLGLLCLVAVDGITQFCFLLFSAAALYLLCYDRFLRRAAPDLSSGVWNVAPRAGQTVRGDASAWATQSMLVSSVWFALFLGGGALLFWPLQMLAPNMMTPRWDRGQGGNGERKLDYSGGASVMELRGGTHALSPRVLLRVTPLQGLPGGLWRGRVYERYDRSLWGESEEVRKIMPQPQPPLRLVQPRALGVTRGTPPVLAPRSGRVEMIEEIVVPLGGVADVVYSSGLPLKWEAYGDAFRFNDPDRTHDSTRSQAPYRVRSFITQPNLRVLDATPGFDAKAGNTGMAPRLRANLKLNLRLPDEAATRTVLHAVAAQVRANSETDTPSQKARAVADYLRASCLYSLQAPAVPPTADATVFFLTDSRRGACDMFASSAALLLREMGVPARVATGFLDPDSPDSSSEDAQGRAVKILRERDAHAWVEYYVPGYGWLSFDPTRNTREVPPTVAGRLAEMFNFSGLNLPLSLWILPLLGASLLLAGVLWQRRADADNSRQANERARAEAAYASALRLLRRRVPHAPHMAPAEYETRVAQSALSLAAKQEFSALTHLYLAARYGPPTSAAGDHINNCLQRLKAALRRGAKN